MIGQNITSHILFQRSRQSRDERIDQPYVTVCARQAARELRKFHDLGAGGARNFLRDSAIVKWFDNNSFDMLRFHLRDYLGEMRRRRRNSRLWFEEDIDTDTETMREVRPRIVIGHNMLAFKW